jgi:hypothetical protein
MLVQFDNFKLFLDILAHRNRHLLNFQFPLILVIALAHQGAVSGRSYVSVCYYSKMSYLSSLKNIILIFLRERKPIF